MSTSEASQEAMPKAKPLRLRDRHVAEAREDDLYEPLTKVTAADALNVDAVQGVETLLNHWVIKAHAQPGLSSRQLATLAVKLIQEAIASLEADKSLGDVIPIVAKAIFGVSREFAHINRDVRIGILERAYGIRRDTYRRARVRATLAVAHALRSMAESASADNDSNLDPTRVEPITRVDVLGSQGWLATLEDLYPQHQLLDFAGTRWPITVFPAAKDEWPDLESCLVTEAGKPTLSGNRFPGIHEYVGDFDPAGRSEFDYHGSTASDKKWSGKAFNFTELQTGQGRTKILCHPGRYFVSLATSESFDAELVQAHAQVPDQPVALRELPRRNWLHTRAVEAGIDPVTNGAFRSASVSVAMTIICANSDGTWDLLMSPRSKEVATHPGFMHVLPSGIFQPMNHGRALAEYSVRRCILREYVEEMYADEEYNRATEYLHNIDEADEVKRLMTLVGAGSASLHYTGISINLFTLRPEICTLLLVRDTSWRANEAAIAKETGRPLMLNWEYMKDKDEHYLPLNAPFEHVLTLDSNFEIFDEFRVAPDYYIPNAAAAMDLGIRVAKELAG